MPEHVLFGQEDILAVFASPIILRLRISTRAFREMYGLQPFVGLSRELDPAADTTKLLWPLGAFFRLDVMFNQLFL
jgi:hypothetical protein